MLGSDFATSSLFRQNSVSGKTRSSLLLVGSAAGQTPVQPLFSAVPLSHARNECNAAHTPLTAAN